jgi:hypothetical protein
MALLDMAPGALVRSKARWRYVFQSAEALSALVSCPRARWRYREPVRNAVALCDTESINKIN